MGLMLDFYNDIITFIATMNTYLKVCIITLFCMVALLLLKNILQNMAKDDLKVKMKILPFVLFVMFIALAVFVAVV